MTQKPKVSSSLSPCSRVACLLSKCDGRACSAWKLWHPQMPYSQLRFWFCCSGFLDRWGGWRQGNILQFEWKSRYVCRNWSVKFDWFALILIGIRYELIIIIYFGYCPLLNILPDLIMYVLSLSKSLTAYLNPQYPPSLRNLDFKY